MLGKLSAQYESDGNPAEVSTGVGDAGGISYGKYQLASNVGSVDDFLEWGECQTGFYKDYTDALLASGEINSDGFIAKWREIGSVDPTGFGKMQDDYFMYAYYGRAAELLESNYFHMDNHSDALKEVVFSRAVQYGIGSKERNTGVIGIFFDALDMMAERLGLDLPNLSYIDALRFDYDLIACIYDVCMTTEWNSGALRESLNNRFVNEKAQALDMLMSELKEKGY